MGVSLLTQQRPYLEARDCCNRGAKALVATGQKATLNTAPTRIQLVLFILTIPETFLSIVVIVTPKEWNVSRRYFTPTFFFSHVSAVQWLRQFPHDRLLSAVLRVQRLALQGNGRPAFDVYYLMKLLLELNCVHDCHSADLPDRASDCNRRRRKAEEHDQKK